MIEVKGNLWDFPADFRVITTNGAVKYNGACVMGRGCAREAKDKYHNIEFRLGNEIKRRGNHVHYLQDLIISFPVKHHWKQQADLKLIEQSTQELLDWVDNYQSTYKKPLKVVLPRPGCGNGSRDWEEVKPILEKYLDDRFYVITF